MICKFIYIDYGNSLESSTLLPTHLECFVNLYNSKYIKTYSTVFYQFYKVRFLKIKKDKKGGIAFELINGDRNFTHLVVISKRFRIESKHLTCFYDDHYKLYIGEVRKVIKFSVVDALRTPLLNYYLKYDKTNKKLYSIYNGLLEEL